MLRSLKDLESYEVAALDGDVGKVTDFLFDDRHWTTRYLVTDTSGFWQEPHSVLISPVSFRQADWETRRFHLGISQDKVKKSPSITKDQPVSRQFERDYAHYYGWPYYWGFVGIWGMGAYPRALADSSLEEERKRHAETQNDPHLRSAKEVTGYHVHGSDGEVGHICDFIVDDETWTIRFLVIDTSNWWFGKKVLVAPQWAQSISWSKSMVNVSLTMEMIKNSPEWNPDRPVNREYEQRLYDYYGRPAYWPSGNEPTRAAAPMEKIKHLSV